MATTIAAQMYTLRDFTKTPADIASSLAKVKKIGYDAVQLSALGPIDPKELAKILQGEGLFCTATHMSIDALKNRRQQIIDDHHLWGCQYVAIGGFFPKSPSAQDWIDFARSYGAIASDYKSSGLKIGYHNHSHELAHYDGKPAFDLLLANVGPDVWFELDTYWITHGGGDPCVWIDRVSGNIPCIHFKDMAVTNDRKQLMAEVGEGNLNWPRILDSCRKAGVKWYIVEQDVCQRDPFESLAISLRNMKAMGLK